MFRPLRTALAAFLLVLAAVVGVVGAVGVGSPAAAEVSPGKARGQEIAASLQADPVLVDSSMGGDDPDYWRERFSGLIAEHDYPIYVALVLNRNAEPLPIDSSGLAAVLHEQLGRGLYIVSSSRGSPRVRAWDVPVDDTTINLAGYRMEDQVVQRAPSSAGEARYLDSAPQADLLLQAVDLPEAEEEAVVDAAVESPHTWASTRLGDYQTNYYSPAELRADAAHDNKLRGMLVVATSLLFAMLAARMLLARTASGEGVLRALIPRFRSAGSATGSALESARARTPAKQDLEMVVRVEDMTGRSRTPDLPDRHGYLEALAKYDAARERLSQKQRADDLVAVADDYISTAALVVQSDKPRDLVGAVTMVRYADQVVRRVRSAKAGPPYPPCFFNPLHEWGAQDATWSPHGSPVSVPACLACSRAVAEGRGVDALVFPGLFGAKPYYAGNDVWARTGYGALTTNLAHVVLSERAEDRR